MTAKPMSRLVHRAFPHRNPLASTGDRVESAVLVLGIAVSMLAVPVACAVGSEIYASQKNRVVVEQASKKRVDAILTEDAPPAVGMSERSGAVESAFVRATWRLDGGTTRRGEVQARRDAKAGAIVPVWVGEDGMVTEPPLTSEGAAIDAVFLALLLWSAAAGSAVLLHLITRFAHKRVRMGRWAKEWKRIAPEWTGR
ncbi:hypothetical protein SAMN05216553_13513 [Lentzea fradiae]|uniref:Transmembrane protein n=1 Tax=Lentzea fradiae TaxID=200378 RepID=A0A1G8DTI8_9PSEU|nr:hypothetical protein [Lentzea fradiae]SDH61026.1 hypothetical protein SAMN05216553_13513 [Lentzea fradiae]